MKCHNSGLVSTLSSEKRVLSCEQCGQPLGGGGSVTGCLNCLLLGGLGPDTVKGAPVPATSSARFYQHYEIFNRADGALWELGRGAMGVTYKAIDVNLQMFVALKVINAKFSAHPEARARFLREARSAAKLQHPNVAGVHHFGTISFPSEIGDGTECFYAMEFIEGETLESYVRREGSLHPVAALEIALQIAHALGAAERRGLVHRDLKPANVMLTTEGVAAVSLGRGCPPHDDDEPWVKVIDFGLAKAIRRAAGGKPDGGQPAEDDGPLTRGGFLGTPQFASPEQFAGAELDARSDIFSLGVTLWYALTGDLPFDGESLAEVRDRQLHRGLPVAQLSDAHLPTPVVRLLGHMLSPVPAKRPPSAAALCERLHRCLTTLREGGVLGQLKTRRVYRVVLGYAVGASLLMQACAVALPEVGAPVWAMRTAIILSLFGLGMAALWGWAVDRRAVGKTHLPRHVGRRLGFVAMALLPAALTAAFFLLRPAPEAPKAAPAAAKSR